MSVLPKGNSVLVNKGKKERKLKEMNEKIRETKVRVCKIHSKESGRSKRKNARKKTNEQRGRKKKEEAR